MDKSKLSTISKRLDTQSSLPSLMACAMPSGNHWNHFKCGGPFDKPLICFDKISIRSQRPFLADISRALAYMEPSSSHFKFFIMDSTNL